MKKISVIIPIYGVEKYIRQCLESVINQTYKNLEIIIVNDGTKDNSMTIVEEYLSDERIKIINKENGGISSARNAGLDIATGEYISFVDSDDWLELDLYERLMENLSDEEIVVFNYRVIDDKSLKLIKIKKIFKNNIIMKTKRSIGGEYLFDIEPYVWNKLYKKELIEKYKFRFIKNIEGEDSVWSYESYVLSEKVVFKVEDGYNYRVNRVGSLVYNYDNDISEKQKERNKYSSNKIKKYFEEFLEKNKLEKEEKIFFLLLLEGKNINEKYYFDYSNLKKEIKEYIELQNSKKISNNKIKEKIIKQIKIFLRTKKGKVININLFDLFFWKNKILDYTTFKRIILSKIKYRNVKLEKTLQNSTGNKNNIK